jgi:hypothetical protein
LWDWSRDERTGDRVTDLPSPQQVDRWTNHIQADLDWLCRQGPKDKWGRAGNYHYAHSGLDGVRSSSYLSSGKSGTTDLVGSRYDHGDESYKGAGEFDQLHRVQAAAKHIQTAQKALQAARRALEDRGAAQAGEGPRGRFVRTAELQALRQAQKRREQTGGFGTT